MNKRKTARHYLLVDIEIAQSGKQRRRGYVNNISREGLSVTLQEGQIPTGQKSVLLNFKIWTGSETLFRKMHAKIVRIEEQEVGMRFAEHDLIATAIVQDLLHYKAYERRNKARSASSNVLMTEQESETLPV